MRKVLYKTKFNFKYLKCVLGLQELLAYRHSHSCINYRVANNLLKSAVRPFASLLRFFVVFGYGSVLY